MNRGPLAEIDLSSLQHNLQIVSSIVGKKPVIAVVKADAYGHGAVAVARSLAAAGVSCFAVAYTAEAGSLRDSGLRGRILVLFDRTGIDDYFQFDLTPVLHDVRTAEIFSREAVSRGKKLRVHIKIDTGMGRMGFDPARAVSDSLEIAAMNGLEVEGLMSHFSEADLADRSYAVQQLKTFLGLRDAIVSKIGHPLLSHMANSAAVLSMPDAHLDAVRPGLALYGCSPFPDRSGFLPVMSLKTRILALRNLGPGSPVSYARTFITARESRIAVLPVGYADGFDRRFSNNGEVLVRGKRVPVVGRVCMDATMIDVTDIPDAAEGDEVVIVGRQGEETLTAHELALRIRTIPYEIMTSLGMRAGKEYIN